MYYVRMCWLVRELSKCFAPPTHFHRPRRHRAGRAETKIHAGKPHQPVAIINLSRIGDQEKSTMVFELKCIYY